MSVELVIFDCDGVLVDSEVIANQVFSDYLKRHGLDISPEDCTRRFVGLSLSSCKTKIADEDGVVLPDNFVGKLRDETLVVLAESLDPVPGIRAALDAITLPVCVASSGSLEKITGALTKTGLIEHFGGKLFSADQVVHGKPAPDLFLYAAKHMNMDPTGAVVIEDSPAGVQAGAAAGMTVIGFTGAAHITDGHGAALRSSGAHHILDHMQDLPALLETLHA